ncbi:MAG TPA: amidohydrolase family protein [Azospirillaceae bacterium]|nr:amidohydrolase family protein [Azospirillaceae bacterium]
MTDHGLDPEGTRLPVKIDTATNGEFEPVALPPAIEAAIHEAHRAAGENARRLGLGRRAFLTSACGVATTLAALNEAHAAAGRTGGSFDLPKEAGLDRAAADSVLAKREFVFDVQGHHVNPSGAWIGKLKPDARPLSSLPHASCGAGDKEVLGYLNCFGADRFVKDVFLDSDTDMMVLSFTPAPYDRQPLTIEEAAATRALVKALDGTERLLLHCPVNPNVPDGLAPMERAVSEFRIAAFKTYTQFGPQGPASGFRLTDQYGTAFIEKARDLGVPMIAIHKGLPFSKQGYEFSTCDDVGPAAARHPDVTFLIYHAGYDSDLVEGPYDPKAVGGIDTLVRSLEQAGVKPGANVYAELGSTWRFLMLRDPTQAAHALGKLLKAVGPDRVLWGTDSIWYGSPQDQIQAFRAFQISKELQEKHGYPELTPGLKAKIFGLNALKPYKVEPSRLMKRASLEDADLVQRLRHAYTPDPAFETYGPKTRAEFLRFKELHG